MRFWYPHLDYASWYNRFEKFSEALLGNDPDELSIYMKSHIIISGVAFILFFIFNHIFETFLSWPVVNFINNLLASSVFWPVTFCLTYPILSIITFVPYVLAYYTLVIFYDFVIMPVIVLDNFGCAAKHNTDNLTPNLEAEIFSPQSRQISQSLPSPLPELAPRNDMRITFFSAETQNEASPILPEALVKRINSHM